MFVREKTVNGYTYLYLVESVRENGRTKQRIIRNLGRKEAVLASGALDRLIASLGRFAERTLVLRAIEEGDARFEVRRIGAPLLFGRLWEETGCRAVCTEMLSGNTSDSTVLLPVVDRLRSRFAIGRVCVVADRGMISAATIAALEERGLEYILGTRERGDVRVRRIVLESETPFVPLLLERARGETQLFVKEVTANGVRYIVCRNEAEAEKDRADRLAIVDGLQRRLKQGDKALIANAGYRRYLRRSGEGAAFEIDAGKLAEEARYDGIFVLRTNARITPLNAVLRYRELLMVEALFRAAKATFDTRPIFHSRDAAIRGHAFCSFLALVLAKELQERCARAGFQPEWERLVRDLDRLQSGVIEKDNTRITVRTPVTGEVGPTFRAAGVALPPNIAEPPTT